MPAEQICTDEPTQVGTYELRHWTQVPFTQLGVGEVHVCVAQVLFDAQYLRVVPSLQVAAEALVQGTHAPPEQIGDPLGHTEVTHEPLLHV